jgi:alkylhydroperoxidase family enzyme
MDFSNQQPPVFDVAGTLSAVARVRGVELPAGYALFAESPGCVAWLATCLETWTGLDRAMLAAAGKAVAAALPASRADVTGFHARPEDPLEALAFVATRYAARTTDALVDAVRQARGCNDAELTDIFYAIAMCNCWERMDRLLAHMP